VSYVPIVVATYYVHLFPARNDVYSRWTPDGWRPVREPLTPEVALAGLTKQGPSISGYMIAPDSTSHSFAIDFDSDTGAADAVRLAEVMEAAGAPVYLEASRRGAHLWGALEKVLPARTIRRALRAFCVDAGLPDKDPKIELRPGTDTISEGGLGHALRLPMMPHPVTGSRGILTRHGARIGTTLADTLLAIDLVPASVLVDRAATYVPPVDPSNIDPRLLAPRRIRDGDDYWEQVTVSEILRSDWGVANAVPGRAVRCPAHDDKVPSLSILRDDRRVICKAPGCILNNNDHGRGTYELHKLAPLPSS
jgi:hypothetical protein